MNMCLTVFMYAVLMALTPSDGTSAFRGLDFTPVFKGPTNFSPDDPYGSGVERSGFGKRLSDIEARFDAVTNMESRLDDMEQRLEASKSNDTHDKEIETKMDKMEGELETVQDTLSALSAVANNVDQIQAAVAASSEKHEQDKKSLVEMLAAARGRVSGIEAEVQVMKSKLNNMEGNFHRLKSDVRCPSDYMYDGTTTLCLKLVRAPSTSSDANINCLTQADDGRLAQLDTWEKHEFARSYLRSQGQNRDVYVGGIRDGTGKYTWLDGREIRNADWCPGQPEHRGCVSLWHDKGFCLDDVYCSGRMAYLCEVPLDE
ncbi:uncharacterized protein [Haliotis asinina]|uniref:uncharacterized protein n=1 Tax=Haliotis asinina TaxID=109174 RepID=UPI0035321DF2